MRTTLGDMWNLPATAKVIPTNGIVNQYGHAVMGAGVALQAAQRVPELPGLLGGRLKDFGNRLFVFRLTEPETHAVGAVYIITLPTKYDWRDPAEISHLTRGVKQLVEASFAMGWQSILLPEIGMGLGGLPRESVYPVLRNHLDDRFTVVKYDTEKSM